ncbi:hypothetical protein NJB18091_29490 [Mycobacterium marinum]|uniref:Uncharacterized protein n=2 Tax=Mycobacterium marinum TaxID=1781 RepID=B2HEH4_MYCMM|nr:hypothetical protein MMAR_4596 [Mycobacterium marinum M]GJN99262.1 hypothetical protein NJB18091_29490 [Mycobacterium marinum]GJO18810.1 hypothetical protein NJB1507_11110 [Mycobacterium marinum]
MSQPDPMQLLTLLMNRAQTREILSRTEAKVKRGAQLRQWAMGVPRNLVDPASSIAQDNKDFLTNYLGGDIVSTTAVYPVMTAIDGLTSMAELIAGREASKDSHASSLLTLSRMAVESAATTIWLLSNTDRAARQNVSLRFNIAELNAQRGFQSFTQRWFERGAGKGQPIEYRKFLEHVRLHGERMKVLESERNKMPKVAVLDGVDVVRAAARWLDKQPPPHETEGPCGRDELGFEHVAMSFYNVSSGVVHGLKWLLDYMPNGEVDLHRAIVEGVNVSVSMAECAVALFEAQAQDWHNETDRPRLYPEALQPTVEQWAQLYPVEPAHR